MTPDWTEIEYDRHRYRYRFDGKEHANPSAGLELEWRSSTTGEWFPARSVNSPLSLRGWFTVGWLAHARASGQVEMRL